MATLPLPHSKQQIPRQRPRQVADTATKRWTQGIRTCADAVGCCCMDRGVAPLGWWGAERIPFHDGLRPDSTRTWAMLAALQSSHFKNCIQLHFTPPNQQHYTDHDCRVLTQYSSSAYCSESLESTNLSETERVRRQLRSIRVIYVGVLALSVVSFVMLAAACGVPVASDSYESEYERKSIYGDYHDNTESEEDQKIFTFSSWVEIGLSVAIVLGLPCAFVTGVLAALLI